MELQIPGLHFNPNDSDLLGFYLKRKLNNSLQIPHGFFLDFDIYSVNPWELPIHQFNYTVKSHNVMYFFTPRHPASNPNPSSGRKCRFSRTAGSGFWNGNGRDKLIEDDNGVVIGHTTSYNFVIFGENKKTQKTNWLMHEYRLHNQKSDDVVISKVYEKKSRARDEDSTVSPVSSLIPSSSQVDDEMPHLKRRRISEDSTCASVSSVTPSSSLSSQVEVSEMPVPKRRQIGLKETNLYSEIIYGINQHRLILLRKTSQTFGSNASRQGITQAIPLNQLKNVATVDEEKSCHMWSVYQSAYLLYLRHEHSITCWGVQNGWLKDDPNKMTEDFNAKFAHVGANLTRLQIKEKEQNLKKSFKPADTVVEPPDFRDVLQKGSSTTSKALYKLKGKQFPHYSDCFDFYEGRYAEGKQSKGPEDYEVANDDHEEVVPLTPTASLQAHGTSLNEEFTLEVPSTQVPAMHSPARQSLEAETFSTQVPPATSVRKMHGEKNILLMRG